MKILSVLLGLASLSASAQTYMTIAVTNSAPMPIYLQGYVVGFDYWSTNTFQVPSNSVVTWAGSYGITYNGGYSPQFLTHVPAMGTNYFYWNSAYPLPGPATMQFISSSSHSNDTGLVVMRFDRVRTVHQGQRVP